MKRINLLLICIIFFGYFGTICSQNIPENEFSRDLYINLPPDSVYYKTIHLLQEKGYFILSLDKQSGFIQAKTYTHDNKILSDRMGDRRIYNFFIYSTEPNFSQLSISIYLERSYRSSVQGGWVYYDRDIGPLKTNNEKNAKIFETIIDQLSQKFSLY